MAKRNFIKEVKQSIKNLKRNCLPATRLCLDYYEKKLKNVKRAKTLDEIADFIETLDIPTGGEKFKLLDWQKLLITGVFGSYDDLGFPNESLVTMPRKNGKTSICAAIMYASMKFSKIVTPSIIIHATKREQATKVLKYLRGTAMQRGGSIKANGVFSNEDWNISNNSAVYKPNLGEIICLSSVSETADGQNPQLCVVDEASQVQDDLYQIISTSKSVLPNQHYIYISTLSELEHLFFKTNINMVIKQLEQGEEPDFCPIFYSLDVKDIREDDYGDEDLWDKLNPSIPHTITLDNIRKDYNIAMENRQMLPAFLIKRMNVGGVSTNTQLCTYANAKRTIESFTKDEVEEILKHNEIVLGIDISFNSNMTSISLLTKVDGAYFAKNQNFMNQDSFKRRVDGSGFNILEKFRQSGEIIICGTDRIDFDMIIDWIKIQNQRYDIVMAYGDKATAGFSLQDRIIDEVGLDYDVFTSAWKKYPCNALVEAISANVFHMSPSELWVWELMNGGMKEMKNHKTESGELADGSYEIVRLNPSSFNGLDGVFAVLHALSYYRENETSKTDLDKIDNLEESLRRINAD